MANNCFFEMKIWGEEDKVNELCDMLAWSGKYKRDGLGHVFYFEAGEYSNGSVEGLGECAWSIEGAMIDSASRKLLEETKRLGLVVEAFSSETGCCFQEHYVIAKGEVIVVECVDYQEYFVEAYEVEGTLEEVAEELGVTVEFMRENTNLNGDFTVGGFENWGEFADLSKYLERDPKDIMLEEHLKETLEKMEGGISNMEKQALEGVEQQESPDRDNIDIER